MLCSCAKPPAGLLAALDTGWCYPVHTLLSGRLPGTPSATQSERVHAQREWVDRGRGVLTVRANSQPEGNGTTPSTQVVFTMESGRVLVNGALYKGMSITKVNNSLLYTECVCLPPCSCVADACVRTRHCCVNLSRCGVMRKGLVERAAHGSNERRAVKPKHLDERLASDLI